MLSRAFPKQSRLTSAQIRTVFEKGKRLQGSSLILIYFSMPKVDHLVLQAHLSNKIAIFVGKKYSKKAVERNRVKRLLKEIYRCQSEFFPAPCHYVFLQQKSSHEVTRLMLLQDIKRLIKQIRLSRE